MGDSILKVVQLANVKTRSLFSDNGGDYINTNMKKFSSENSIFQQTRSINFPSEHGKAKSNFTVHKWPWKKFLGNHGYVVM